MPEKNQSNNKGISYIYRCKNRGCAYFKTNLTSDKDPLAHIEEKGLPPLCPTCANPLILYRTNYDRAVFRKHVPSILLGEPGDYLPEILRRSIESVDKERKSTP